MNRHNPLLQRSGVIARRHYRHEEALRYLRRALQLADQLEDKLLQTIMLGIIGMVNQDMGQYETAVRRTNALRDRFTRPEMAAEIDYTLWQITCEPDVRATAVAQLQTLVAETNIMAYRKRLEEVEAGKLGK